ADGLLQQRLRGIASDMAGNGFGRNGHARAPVVPGQDRSASAHGAFRPPAGLSRYRLAMSMPVPLTAHVATPAGRLFTARWQPGGAPGAPTAGVKGAPIVL